MSKKHRRPRPEPRTPALDPETGLPPVREQPKRSDRAVAVARARAKFRPQRFTGR